jgi:aldehyde dehydrogenase (NAD+)
MRAGTTKVVPNPSGAVILKVPVDQAVNTAHRIDAGWVQINQGGGQVVGQSYGGYKQSGIGREVSLEGMLAGFTQTKQINIRLRS